MSISWNPMSLLSKAAETVCDSVLPSNMEFVGDILSVAVDLKTGNFAGVMGNFADLTQDLPQQINSLTRDSRSARGAQARPHEDFVASPLEPGPPPHLPPPRRGFGLLDEQLSLNAPAMRGEAPAPAAPLASSTATGATNVSGTSTSTDVSTTAPAKTEETTQPAKVASAEATDKASTSASADDFFKKSDKDLMNAVRDGKLPKEVTSDPQQMQRLQLRMNEISEMNKLITSMLSAIHDMNNQVIQNIRA